jgi:hypothetical protein
LSEQRVTQQTVGWDQFRAQLQRMFERWNGGSEILSLQVSLPQMDEAVRKSWLKLGYLSKLSDGNSELLLFFRLDTSLHVLSGVWGSGLSSEPQQ